jgi:ABC-2 type transport system ATP-binding protein
VTALATDGLTKRFGQTLAVDGAEVRVEAGEVRGLLGPNGAGKTTLLRLLLGLVRPDAGTIELHGRSLGDPRRLESVAGFVEDPSFYPYLSARANLAVLGDLDGGLAGSAIDDALALVELGGRGEERVAGYSTGMRKRLGIAAALMRAPRLLLLDEPTAGLDPAGVRFISALVRSLAAEGVAVLLSSHQIGEVDEICDSFTVLRRGRTVWSGTAAEMRAQAPPPSHLLRTADDSAALALLAAEPGALVVAAADGGLAVEASRETLDALVLSLGRAGIAIRRLEPAARPLEAMFFALVGEGNEGEAGKPADPALARMRS